MINDTTEMHKLALATCEAEPIQIPGAIQSHGILVTLRASDLTILQISASVFDILGVHPDELLHQPLSKLMKTESVEKASRRLGERTPRLLNPIPLEIMANGKLKRFDGILHRSGRIFILELEVHVKDEESYVGFGGFYEAIRDVTSKFMVADNLPEIFDLACDEVRTMTDFSRVVIYQFDEEWNGSVIAESKRSDAESLLHHRFPASDIPKQARDLYVVNWLRLIPNVNYTPSRLVPQNNPITDRPLDMSNSVLRSVSPLHLEYMRNMGQAASMSVSLIKGKKLWGLISCHHPEPLYLRYETRVACEFIGQMVSAQIVAREETTDVDHKLQLKALYDDLLRSGGATPKIIDSLRMNVSALLGLTDAQGAVMSSGGRMISVGTTPADEILRRLCVWVLSRNEPVTVTDSLAQVWNAPEAINEWMAGVLAISIPEIDLLIIWIRPELKASIPWGGNPNFAKEATSDGRLHPRKSFATWLENTSGRSSKWMRREFDAADELRRTLSEMRVASKSDRDSLHSDPFFRDSLVNALATTAATQESREPVHVVTTSAASFSDAAKTSRLLLDGFSEFAVLFLNVQGEIQNWSSSAQRLLGFSQAQILNQGIQSFFSEDEVLKGKQDRVLDAVRERGRCEEELWLFRSDATSFWGKIMCAQVVDEARNQIGFSVVIEDVTKEKAAEEELKATKLAAEAANRAKTAFLANISHEIRTPLGAVLGFAELMNSGSLSIVARNELYERVRKNGEQLTVLINDLLDLTKVEAGRLEVEKIEIDLEKFLSDLYKALEIKAREKSIDFKVEINGELPSRITSDPTRLRQILINMLGNAFKFTPDGGRVRLSCSVVKTASGLRLDFRVIDNGKGMSQTEMGRLFQPFIQADASTTRKYGGTGLGLFVSQRLARSLNGDLIIEKSVVNSGSTFLATIDPGENSSQVFFSSIRTPVVTLNTSRVENKDLLGISVLVVDDAVDNRHLIKMYLTKAGAVVELAENGLAGVEAAQAGEFDIVLMDIQMPLMDGNEAMKQLHHSNYSKPVIALTAHAMKEEREHSLSLGFRSYLTKPINRTELIKTIRELVPN